jgi:hypothetical protein
VNSGGASALVSGPAPMRGTQAAAGSAANDDLLTSMMSALSVEEPLLRAHRLQELLGRLSPAELASLFEHAVRVEDHDLRATMLAALIQRWARVDPSGVNAAVRPYRERVRNSKRADWRGVDTIVCIGWAKAEPATAFAEAMAHANAPWAGWIAYQAMTALAGGDPLKQLELLVDLPPGRLRDDLCENAIKALADKDSAAAEAQLGLLSNPRQRAQVQSDILKKLAERDPAGGLDRLSALAPGLVPSVATTKLLAAVITAAAKRDPAAALAIVNEFPENVRAQAVGAALVGWAGKNPVDALAWAAANGIDPTDVKAVSFYGSTDEPMWNTLASVAFQKDSAKTLEWLRSQPESAERDRMMREGIWGGSAEAKIQIYSELTPQGRIDEAQRTAMWLARANVDRAEAWVKDLEAGQARTSAVQGLLSYQVNNSPERSDELAEAWAAGPDRDAALRGIAIAQEDPYRGMEFARKVGDAAGRELAFESIARSWLRRDRSSAREWIASTQDLAPWQKRVLLRQSLE